MKAPVLFNDSNFWLTYAAILFSPMQQASLIFKTDSKLHVFQMHGCVAAVKNIENMHIF